MNEHAPIADVIGTIGTYACTAVRSVEIDGRIRTKQLPTFYVQAANKPEARKKALAITLDYTAGCTASFHIEAI